MTHSDIVVGGNYSNPTEKYGGVRIVDAIFKRTNDERALTDQRRFTTRAFGPRTRRFDGAATFARWVTRTSTNDA
jgi:hypothetical protein